MSQADRAIESLYEDANLREELVDSEARLLLQWGEQRIGDLARRNLPDAQFDEALDHLRQLLKRINRYIGRRATMTPDEQQSWLSRIVESANALGYNVTVEQMSMDFQAQGVADNHAALSALMATIDTANAAPISPEKPLLPDTQQTGDLQSNDEEIQSPE